MHSNLDSIDCHSAGQVSSVQGQIRLVTHCRTWWHFYAGIYLHTQIKLAIGIA